jgi:hypothetical protein
MIDLPQGGWAYMPADIHVRFPGNSDVALSRRHLLAYIQWDDTYLDFVPAHYRGFFKYALPHLHARTSNIHTALSFSFFYELMTALGGVPDERLAAIALSLHDCGWSAVTSAQLADSLDYSGIAFTPNAAEAKRLHCERGARLARHLLQHYHFHPALSEDQIQFVCDIISFHERINEFKINGQTPKEFIVVCEADRLWPFAYENFWLDTVRKGVSPHVYIHNVERAIDSGLLLTDYGRMKARQMVEQRKREVLLCPVHPEGESLESPATAVLVAAED